RPPPTTLFPYTTLFRSDAAPHRIMLNEVGDLKQRRRAGHRSVGHGRSAISAARQHAARWPPPQSCNSGYASWQRATASEQRGARSEEHTSELQSRFDLV